MACRNKEENNMDSKASPNERHFVGVMIHLLRDSETMLKVCDEALRLKNRSRRYEATLHHLGKESKQLKGVILNTLDKQLKATSKVKGLTLLHFSKGIIKIWLLCFNRLQIVSTKNLAGKKKKEFYSDNAVVCCTVHQKSNLFTWLASECLDTFG